MENKICLRCKEIKSFCECDVSMFDKDEYILFLENRLLHIDRQLDKTIDRVETLQRQVNNILGQVYYQ